MLLTPNDGIPAASPEQGEQLKNAGYLKCYGQYFKAPCNFFLSPEAQAESIDQAGGYYTCPACKQSHDLMEDMPSHKVDDEYADFSAGGGTRVGIPMQEQAQIGEDLIAHMGSLPGYGPIIWWHQGGSVAKSPLDGATRDWGIEVKTIGYDAIHHRFIPGGTTTKQMKNDEAQKMGLSGILGLLVLLNYKTSMADVYVREMPLAPWKNAAGRTHIGVASFRSSNAEHLLERIPFKNPLVDPTNSAPQVHEDLPF